MTQNQIEDVFYAFSESEEHQKEQAVLDAAARWIADVEPEGRPFFALVHLGGGHAPYKGNGDTEWDRHVDACAHALRSVADFVNNISRDHLVVVMGDHGEEFGEHDGGGHAFTLYEEVLATPLLIRGLSSPADGRSCALGCRDLVATMHDAALGVESNHCLHGTGGRFAMVDSPNFNSREPTSIHIRALYLAEQHKVIWDAGLDIWGLFDLAQDPGELVNLASDKPDELLRAATELATAIENCPHANW